MKKKLGIMSILGFVEARVEFSRFCCDARFVEKNMNWNRQRARLNL